MAQSSNYKVYNRQPRVLTEETGFAGGMLWTGNNIDETHLKTIVNFVYDDTTGYLKIKDPILLQEEYYIGDLDVDLSGKQLVGAYKICPELVQEDKSTVLGPADWLYIFGNCMVDNGVTRCAESSLVILYTVGGSQIYKVELVTTDESDFDELVWENAASKKPVLYDNRLYTTCNNDLVPTVVYGLFVHDGEEDYMLVRQGYNVPDGYFLNTYKNTVDSITLLEASNTGFNAMRGDQMYSFTGDAESANPMILGVLLYEDKSCTVPVARPRVGQKLIMHVLVAGQNISGTTHKVIIQKPSDKPDELWQTYETLEYAGDNIFVCREFVVQDRTATYNVVLSSTSSQAQPIDAVIINYSTSRLNTTKIKAYPLTQANSCCAWKTHLVMWGVPNNANILFISEVDNFYYMPAPNNLAVFDTDIIGCVPYMDTLMVFTADKVYTVAEASDGTFTQSVVQNDMPMAPSDAPYIKAIKNMVFFKSGNYYYMIVPKSQSLKGELSIAPIYKNIAAWLDNPSKGMKEILTQLYPDHLYYVEGSFDDTDESNKRIDPITVSDPVEVYAEQDTVTILFNIEAYYYKTVDGIRQPNSVQHLLLFLNYNTNLRAWTMCIESTDDKPMYVAALYASRLMRFVRTTEDHMEVCIPTSNTDPINGMPCLIDSGYRTLSTSIKKRFREVQVKLHSTSENIVDFGSAFYVDGVTRRAYHSFETVYSDSDKNEITLMPRYDPNALIVEPFVTIDTARDDEFTWFDPKPDAAPKRSPEEFMEYSIGDAVSKHQRHGSDSKELTDWRLDFSHFKRGAPATIRVPVSGKGYAPRFVFTTPCGIALTINEINWVYRTMFGR